MSINSARVLWMQQMVAHCFGKQGEDNMRVDTNLSAKFVNFLLGKMGKTLLIYYQKPYRMNEKNEKIDSAIDTYYVNEETKGLELRNRAAFFIRNVPDEKEVSFSTTQDQEVLFGEISSDSIIGMNKVVYNYLYQNADQLDTKDDWNKIKDEHKKEFKKILETFAKDLNETVESLFKGVKFTEIPQNVKDYINQEKKEFVRDEDIAVFQAKIEDIYASWIETLTREIEDMDKDNPAFSDMGPKSELEKWKYRMQRLTKVNDFFYKMNDYRIITKYFGEMKNKQSAKIQSLINEMKQKKIEAHTAHSEARDNVKYLSTLEIYFEPLYNGTPETIIDSLQSLMNSLKLISFTARYYDNTKMTNLFSKITSQMINNCIDYILDRKTCPTNTDSAYLWGRKPDELIAKFKTCNELYHIYKKKYIEAKSSSTSTNKENNFEFGENQLFGKFDQFCKRLHKLIELFTTIKQFEDIRAHKLDSMEGIQQKYDDLLEKFQDQATQLLKYSDTKFDKDYVAFNLHISELENELHKIINEEFKKLTWIEKKLKLLAKYDKILTKPNLQQNLKSEKMEIFSNYKREIDSIQTAFDAGRTSPKLQRNMPKISGRIKWAKHLFNRIYPFINNFKDIAIKDRKETELSYMTTNTLLYSYIILNEKFFEQFVESAKVKLTAPLLVINDTTGPRVNLDLYVLQLIREAKCMMRMNCTIPEAAKIILLQEEKFKRYYNELSFLVKEYNRVLGRINRSEAEFYFRGHIRDLNLKLQPLKMTINWSSMNIDTNLLGVFNCLQRFEYAIDSFMEILDNRVHRNMLSIKKLELLAIPENPTKKRIPEIIKSQDDHVKKQNELLKNKNSEIETAILDMIEGIKSYPLDPKVSKVDDKTLYKLISDYEDKFYDFLMTTTKNSLINLKERITNSNSQPIFLVEVMLTSNLIEISPKVNVIQEAINKMAKSILNAMKGISSWKKPDNSNVISFHEKLGKDNEIVKMFLLLTGSFQSNHVDIEKFLKDTFDPFRPLWMDSIEKRIKEFNTKKSNTYTDYEEKLKEYTGIEDKINAIPDEVTIGAISINLIIIKATLSHYCADWKNAYVKELLRTTRAKAKELNEIINSFQQKLNQKIDKIEELKEVVDTIEKIRIKEGTIEAQIKPFVQFYILVKNHIKEQDFERYNFPTKDTFDTKWQQILGKAGEIRDTLQRDQISYKKKLYADAQFLKEQVNELKKDYEINGPTKEKRVEVAADRLESFRRKVANLNKLWKNIKDGEKIFNVSENNYPQLKEIDQELAVIGKLYDLYMNVLKQKEAWKDMQFAELNANYEEMERKCQEFSSGMFKIDKKLWTSQEYENLKDEILTLQSTVEAFQTLTYNFEEHHWKEISDKLKVKEMETIRADGGAFRLKLLFDAKVHEFKGDIDDIRSKGLNQEKIKKGLAEIEDFWKVEEFKFEPHRTLKDIQLLEALKLNDIKTNVEDHAGRVSGFKAQARNLTAELLTRIKQKEVQFQTINNTIDLWVGVQSLWNSLQSFFIGTDIRKELPGPTKSFEGCHRVWQRVMMDKAFPTKLVFPLCSTNELNPDLMECDKILKECKAKLDLYLEGKRGQFPRFYFVSNSVLLDILSKKSDPANIKSNLNIIFDAMNDIEFNELDKKFIVKIRQIKNEATPNDCQQVDISAHAVKCDGAIESWLVDLVLSMNMSIRDLFEQAYYEIKNFYDIPMDAVAKVNFEAFVRKYICQVVIFGLQLYGTKRLEEFIVRAVEKGDSYKKKLYQKAEVDPSITDFNQILSVLTEMCRGDNKSKLEIVKLEALIIIHVHNKDIYNYFVFDKEMTRQMVTVNDYDWLKQTRVYWYTNYNSSNGNQIRTCLINITDVAFDYGYEFLGAKERMCITPLTDKCYITLAQAMGMQYGGAPAGPAGTGKTETVKDMGRTMGVFVLVTNCAPEHKYKNMAEIFKGLCRSGAWGCFDEFNRIQLEVLSVLATIISAIQDCRRNNQENIKFPESSNTFSIFKLIPTMGYFITMNPGYSGRQELPENLKILFRGVTMMAPNRDSIIRVKLCSYGFDNHDDISLKFKKLYELCEAQLSKQQHYDFGLRNILSVLRQGGNEKKKFKSKPEKEEELIFTAIRDMNLSKLVPDDKLLFLNLIRDVFPNQVNSPQKQYPELSKKISEVLKKRNLDENPQWVEKIIQTYETYHVRHGFMIVGTTGTGKTTIMEVLTEAMGEVENGKWKIHRLNPKAVENEYLFIQKLEDTYYLGVFTNLWKKCNEPSASSKLHNWLVCDGPIDSLWIENLNTVLDDNRILTLSNNERINMLDSCRLVMETENVKNASLATVSRCGMIYITEGDITYKPLINSWFLRNKEIVKDYKTKEAELKDLIENKYLTEDMELKLSKLAAPCMGISWLIKVKNFLLLVEKLLNDKSKVIDKAYMDKVCAFSFAWAIGSLYNAEDRPKFHTFLKNTINAPIDPYDEKSKTTIFECSLEGHWDPWKPDDAGNLRAQLGNFSNLLVPTMDSTRAIFLIKNLASFKHDLTEKSIPCLLLGDAGTAKTSTVKLYRNTFEDPTKIAMKIVNFSSATSPTNFQETVDDELEKSANEYVPILDKSMVFFIDDLSMPYVNKWGDQVTLELVRQLLEFEGYYFIKFDEPRGNMKKISKISFVAAMNHPKRGKNDIPNRLKRHFFIFNMVLPNEQSINDIYGKITDAYFAPKIFGEAISKQARKLPKLTSELLNRMGIKFQPTPVKFHYNYNMRELSRTFQGIFQANQECLKNSQSYYGIASDTFLLVLWKHEVTRVFCDKLRDVEDRKEYNIILDVVLSDNFDKDVTDILKAKEYVFCDHMREPAVNEEFGRMEYPKAYELIKDIENCRSATENFMKESQMDKKKKQVNIVLFDDCLKYLIRVTRIIQAPQNSCMIVGVGGSGKQSLTRLAAYCSQHALIQPSYNSPPKPDDLKQFFRNAFLAIIEEFNPANGKDFLKHTFLMTDAEFKIEYYLEVVSSFLATGEIAYLYSQKNEKNAVISTMRTTLGKMKEFQNNPDLDENQVWGYLINYARMYLHICLCFSPSGAKFREKFIKFPVLFNCCTIMWLLPWPEDALISVVKRFVNNNNKLRLVGKQDQISQLFSHIAGVHMKISEKVCRDYYDKFRRYVYVTPKSYLSFIDEYIKLYINKFDEISKKETTINNGLAKLDEAAKDIEKKNRELDIKVADVEKAKKEVEETEGKLTIESLKVAKIEEEVSIEEEKCLESAKQIEIDNEIVQQELERAKPKLLNAQDKIRAMDKSNLLTVATGANPPYSLRFYFECCSMIMNRRMSLIKDFGDFGIKDNTPVKYYNPLSWDLVVFYLRGNSFFDTIEDWKSKLDGNKLAINDETLELIRPYIETKLPDGKGLFELDTAKFIGGDATKKIAGFCTSISDFVAAVRDVIPKQNKVLVMTEKLEQARRELKISQDRKEEVLRQKKELEDNLQVVKKKREDQEELLTIMQKKVNAAVHLIDSLSSEKKRWEEDSRKFDNQKRQLLGDSAICSAFIAYAGPFNYTFRTEVLIPVLFKGDVYDRGIPLSDSLVVEEFLVDPTLKSEWLMSKLPSDTLSIQNAILVTTSSRFPLLIDPQDQAKNWLLQMHPGILSNNLIFQQSVFCGKKFEEYLNWILSDDREIMIEGIENEVDTTLDPILEKQLLPGNGVRRKLVVGANVYEFDTRFKLFLLCKLINPHFTPELAAKTTIIDFCVTPIGLEQQLQALVISREQKTLEETLKMIMTNITKNENSLILCQKEILESLNIEGNLLENEKIVQVLNVSKSKAEENAKSIKEALEKKADINQKREKYLPVATRGSVLYFSIVQMQEISKMYSSSLQQFLHLFDFAIEHAHQSSNPEQRVKNIVRKLSEHVYKYIVRGLFEKDKTAFILLVCFKILAEEKTDGIQLLRGSDIAFFIKCGGMLNASEEPECPYDFLASKSEKRPKEYINLLALSRWKFNEIYPYFSRLMDKLSSDPERFKTFFNAQDPENCVPYDDLYSHHPKLVAFLKLIFVRAAREDRMIIAAIQHFIPTVLEDKDFLNPYPEDIKDIYNISEAKTPVLYLLSAGADPSTNIENFAKKKGKNISRVSMGEGQKDIAVAMVATCRASGDWVMFQNCHLGLDFMSQLDIMLKDSELDWHPDMRMWLSCEPRNDFPIGLLHQSLKVTNEPPKGIKAGMLKTFSSVVTPEKLDVFEYKEWKNLIFALSFIHSLVIERRKYGPLGFCVPYDFNNSDLEASISFVEKQFQRESELTEKKQPHEMINYQTLTNVVSEILYGGRITDIKDGNLFATIVSSYLEDISFRQANYCFYPSPKDKVDPRNRGVEYRIPDDFKELVQYQNHISNFPRVDPPQVFGLHGSADMTFRLKEFNELIDTITCTLPKDSAGSGGISKEDEIKPKVLAMLPQVPENFVDAEFRQKINSYMYGSNKGLEVPLINVLLQEIKDIQVIIDLVRKSLRDIKEALDGNLLMTEGIIQCIDALYLVKAPPIWMFDANGAEISWLSPNVGSWFEGLKKRAEKLTEWKNTPSNNRPSFYLPGFLNPQGFLAAFKQEYFKLFKKGNTALDQVDLKYEPDKSEIDPKQFEKTYKPKEKSGSIVIYGLYIEGAIWGGNGSLQDDPDSNSRNTIIQFPVIVVSGMISDGKTVNQNQISPYSCPLYKYPKRTDKYLITDIKFKISASEQDGKYWQKRGVALLCNKE